MKTKGLLLLSVFITASLLTFTGGIFSVVGKQSSVSAASQSVNQQATREAEYQSLLNQANQTIEQANKQIASLQAQLQQETSTALPTEVSYPILPDQAAAIASNASGEVVESTPRLVNYNGSVAYEATFSNGKVYVDANSGDVLYNGVAAAQVITASQAAQIASQYIGNSAVSGVVSGLYSSSPAYQVTFQNGEVVYVSANGNVLAVQLPSSNSVGTENNEQDD
jgi:uncharacterized membrane protein YkoI